MKVHPYTNTPPQRYPGLEGVTIRWVIGKSTGAPNFAMRVIEVEPGCNTPYHAHGYEHEVYVLEGMGVVRDAQGGEHTVSSGSVVYIPPNEEHGFFNRGSDVMRIICVVPHVEGLEPELPGNSC